MNKGVRVLQALLAATVDGRIVWKEENVDRYSTVTCAGDAYIEFLYPMLGDETTSGADIAKVSIPGTSLHFFEGTEGMELVRAILDAAFPSWAEWHAGIDAKVERFISGLDAG